jgi:adenylate cyclase
MLEGSVRKAGERVRITSQLIDGRLGGHPWAERYDRGLADISPCRTTSRNGSCAGREQYRRFSKDGNAAARRLFERAIELDPGYAAVHGALAETYLHE